MTKTTINIANKPSNDGFFYFLPLKLNYINSIEILQKKVYNTIKLRKNMRKIIEYLKIQFYNYTHRNRKISVIE